MELTAAQRCYERQKKAQRDYYRRKHPNPKPVGRPRKVVAPEVAAPKVVAPPPGNVWDNCGLCNEGVYYWGEGHEGPCPFCVDPSILCGESEK